MKKRKIIFAIFMIVVAVSLTVTTLLAKQYYDTNYVVDDYYYTVIPWEYDNTPQPITNKEGVIMEYRGVYTLLAYNTAKEERELEFKAYLSFQELYPAGTYVKVSVSKTTVLGQRAISETEIPEQIKEGLRALVQRPEVNTLKEYAQFQSEQLANRNTDILTITCIADDKTLTYTYRYRNYARAAVEAMIIPLKAVYRAQFRADQELFPELEAVVLKIELEDGSEVALGKFDIRVKFGYELD